MKILCIYMLIVNFMLFINSAKDKRSNIIIQSILYFIPTLILIIYVFTKA